MKLMLLVVAMLVVMVAGAAPAFAEQGAAAEEIAVTGVVKNAPDKADGTPAYGITDESSITGTAPPKGTSWRAITAPTWGSVSPSMAYPAKTTE
jgi:hypothetical protein